METERIRSTPIVAIAFFVVCVVKRCSVHYEKE